MLDIYLRSLKDRIFDPVCNFVPLGIKPLHITGAAFAAGIYACACAVRGQVILSLTFWLLNRALDCLDGAVARQRGMASDLGGFLDLLGDFIVYSIIPMACAAGAQQDMTIKNEMMAEATIVNSGYRLWLSVAVVEASFHINNFVLFFVAAILEKRKGAVVMAEGREKDGNEGQRVVKELTSVMMRPALIEGTESAVLFTLMLAMPVWTGILCWTMTTLVAIGICQRVLWLVPVLS